MEERSSRVFWLCLRVVGAARFLGSMLWLIVYCKAAWGRSWMYGSVVILALAFSVGFVQE